MDDIRNNLKAMRAAAEEGNYDDVEHCYRSALAEAKLAFGEEDAPVLLLLICMSNFYQEKGELVQTEAFNRRVRAMCIKYSKEI